MIDDSRIKDIIYKRKNGEDIINDPEAIKSCKNEQSRDIIDNARLGSYDKFGNYIIIPDIKRELIAMPKLIYNVKKENNATTYEMKGNIPIFGDIFFKLTFSKSEAVLSITETVKREANGYLEIFDEPVDSCLSGNGGLPKEEIFKNFHVTENPMDLEQGNSFYDFNNILTRKTYLSLLSKELNSISKVDEKMAFDKMVRILKANGDYGKKVLTEFVERLKDRPGVFEIQKAEKYNKAINEVLLSSLEVATTKEDKEDPTIRKTYLDVVNTRNENIDRYIEEANKRVDEKYVESVVNNATRTYNAKAEKSEEENDFINSLDSKKTSKQTRKLEKAVLKQGKDDEENEEEGSSKEGAKEDGKKENKKDEKKKTKEEKIKAIVAKKKAKEKKKTKKTSKTKKLKPAKKAKKMSKLKAKKKGPKKLGKKPKRKLAKGKLKKKKKKLKKAKSPKSAAKKVGGKLKPPSQSAGGKKKKKADPMLIGRLLVNKFFDKPEVKEEPVYRMKNQEEKPQKTSVKTSPVKEKLEKFIKNNEKFDSKGVEIAFKKFNRVDEKQLEKAELQKYSRNELSKEDLEMQQGLSRAAQQQAGENNDQQFRFSFNPAATNPIQNQPTTFDNQHMETQTQDGNNNPPIANPQIPTMPDPTAIFNPEQDTDN